MKLPAKPEYPENRETSETFFPDSFLKFKSTKQQINSKKLIFCILHVPKLNRNLIPWIFRKRKKNLNKLFLFEKNCDFLLNMKSNVKLSKCKAEKVKVTILSREEKKLFY